jgi:hypothetical protein
MLAFAEMRNIELWYARLPVEELRERLGGIADRHVGHAVDKSIRKGLHRDHLAAFEKLIEHGDGRICFRSDPPTLVPVDDLLVGEQRTRYVEVVTSILEQYRACLSPHVRGLVESYRFMHLARKVVGVGSVGTRCWAVLFVGRDEHDPLLLQLKEAQPSVLAPYAGPTVYESEGRRVVEGQRYMQAASDQLLGWYGLESWDRQRHQYYVRQLWDGKSSIEVAKLTADGLRAYGESCGWTLARGHARSGDRIAISAYLGEDDGFDRAIADFAATYADVNEDDHSSLLEVIAAGRVPALALV